MNMVENAAEKPRKAAKAAATQKAVKRVVLVASEKGGVGKSVVSRTLIDWLRSNGHRVAAYDADSAVGATFRVLGERDDSGALLPTQDALRGVAYYNGRAEGERNIILDSIESGENLFVHDLAGGLLADLTRIVDAEEGLSSLLDAFEVNGYRLTILHVISPDIGSAQSVGRWLDLTGERVDHVALVNAKWGKPPSDFPYWYGFDANGLRKGGKTREKLLAAGGVEVVFPALPAGTFSKLDAENVRFSEADKAGILTITERSHVAKFIKDFEAAFVPIRPYMGL
jgi:hypothetical protein